MKLTVDLIFSGQAFQWVPAELSVYFVNDILGAYYGYKEGALPDLHILTDATRDVMLKVDSHRETKGKYLDYWDGILKGMDDREERKTLRLAVTDKYYQLAFKDVERLLRLLRLSYVNSECPREHNFHYCGEEVW